MIGFLHAMPHERREHARGLMRASEDALLGGEINVARFEKILDALECGLKQ
jgi:hypothetical protein